MLCLLLDFGPRNRSRRDDDAVARYNVLATRTKQPPARDNLPIAQFKPPPSQSNTLGKKVLKELLINYSVLI